MMDWSPKIATATRLISKYGAAAVYRRVTRTPATATPWDDSAVTSDTSVKAVLLDYALKFVDGVTIVSGDKQALVSGASLNFDPAPGDLLIVGSSTWSVVNPGILAPGGVNVLFQMQVRK